MFLPARTTSLGLALPAVAAPFSWPVSAARAFAASDIRPTHKRRGVPNNMTYAERLASSRPPGGERGSVETVQCSAMRSPAGTCFLPQITAWQELTVTIS